MRSSFMGPLSLIVLVLAGLRLAAAAPAAHAQTPTPDAYEENDAPVEAAQIPTGAQLDSLTISPAGDADWFRVLLSPAAGAGGQQRVEALAAAGLDLTLTVYGPDGAALVTHNDAAGPSAAVTFEVTGAGWYTVAVSSTTPEAGWYALRLSGVTPTPAPPPTATPSPTPTAAAPGEPDHAEPNYDFAHAYRLVPGDVLGGLTFASGTPGAADNDFYVMAVREGVAYVCETSDLGPGVDTNLIVYGAADFGAVLGGNDDIDTQAGQIASRVAFSAPHEGDVYLLVGYKYPTPGGAPAGGGPAYTLACQAAAPTPTPTAALAGGRTSPPQTEARRITLLERPAPTPTPAANAVALQTVDVLVGYDRSANGEVDLDEGVRGLSVRLLDPTTNRELAHGLTDAGGAVRFTLAGAGPIRVSIPYLGAAQDFRPGAPARWTLLIPAATAPGLIP